MKGYCDIYIIESDGGFIVRPATWSTDADKRKGHDIIVFRNFTSHDVVVRLPKELVASKQGKKLTLKRARKDGDVGTVALSAKARNLPGFYEYSVTVKTKDGSVAATGHSEPIIIIDPPPQEG